MLVVLARHLPGDPRGRQWLQNDLQNKGPKFIRVTATSPIAQVLQVTKACILVNASDLGAGKLCNDDAVTPIWGQALFVRNRPEFILRQGLGRMYVIPRFASGGILAGSVRQEGIFHGEADPALRKDIPQRANFIAKGTLSDVKLETVVGFRPGRKAGFLLETEGSRRGYVCSFGAVKKVTELFRRLAARKES